MSAEAARAIIRANRFMVLGTADERGRPWVSPVWFATRDEREFVWVSHPGARHSWNLAVRPDVSVVIFDSQQLPGTGEAVYMRAEAAEVREEQLDAALRVFGDESRAQGLREWARGDVLPPARHRLYRAVASEHFVLGAGDERVPVGLGCSSSS
jgi:nitroimidazol reductase NimA-like FMN-containing flavoprotein (pyridoxamine 5'-phosphate oxidase superfamily)